MVIANGSVRDDVKGWGGKHLVNNDMAWCPVSHTGAAQWGAGIQRQPNWLCWEKAVNQKTGCLGNQWVKNKGCLSIQFLLREFCKCLRSKAAIQKLLIFWLAQMTIKLAQSSEPCEEQPSEKQPSLRYLFK